MNGPRKQVNPREKFWCRLPLDLVLWVEEERKRWRLSGTRPEAKGRATWDAGDVVEAAIRHFATLPESERRPD